MTLFNTKDMDLIECIAGAARLWEDPEYSPRVRATQKTLAEDNRFSENSIAFAVNQQMSLLTVEALKQWQTVLTTSNPVTVGVLNPGNIPMVELQDYLAVVLSGHRYMGSVSSKSPFLFPAFIAEIRKLGAHPQATLVSQKDVIASCDKLIASGSDEVIGQIADAAALRGLDAADCWFRGHRFSVAVLDGREREDELVGLAEDALMHEGMGCRNVSIIFAPRRLSVDGVLDTFAAHRAMFPAHAATSGPLRMQQAFLAALDVPHAYADDFQFLISRGEAEEQGPGHIRWVQYDSLDEVYSWIGEHTDRIQAVFADERLVGENEDWQPLGSAQRPELNWCPDGRSHQDFLAG
jgi:hypothetical protein